MERVGEVQQQDEPPSILRPAPRPRRVRSYPRPTPVRTTQRRSRPHHPPRDVSKVRRPPRVGQGPQQARERVGTVFHEAYLTNAPTAVPAFCRQTSRPKPATGMYARLSRACRAPEQRRRPTRWPVRNSHIGNCITTNAGEQHLSRGILSEQAGGQARECAATRYALKTMPPRVALATRPPRHGTDDDLRTAEASAAAWN